MKENNNQKLREALAEIRLLLVKVPLLIKPAIACGIIKSKVKSALAVPPRNCDLFKSVYEADKLHEAFVEYCNACDCPMGCIHKKDTRCMLDTRCGSILKCFAKFVLSEAKGGAE